MVQGRLDSPRLPSSGAGIYACATRCRRLHVSKPGTRGSESARWAEVLAQVFGELRSTDTLMAATTGRWVDHSPGPQLSKGHGMSIAFPGLRRPSQVFWDSGLRAACGHGTRARLHPSGAGAGCPSLAASARSDPGTRRSLDQFRQPRVTSRTRQRTLREET